MHLTNFYIYTDLYLVYAWGDSWEQAKAQCESFDYLFETAVKLKSMGIDCGVKPVKGTYRVKDNDVAMEEEEKKEEPPAKKAKLEAAPVPAFNAAVAADNNADLALTSTTIPLVPRDARTLLLDIEGTTTSISFVKETLFPYARNHLEKYVSKLSSEQLAKHSWQVLKDFNNLPSDHPSVLACKDLVQSPEFAAQNLVARVNALMDNDVKATGLKELQGEIWTDGYNSGAYQGHIYADFKPMLDWCKENEVRVCIYSSGSVSAQKLLFGHTKEGDLNVYLHSYFDTTTGGKLVSSSYSAIAGKLEVQPDKIVFVSDAEAEVKAAREAGMIAVVAVRPGNVALNEVVKRGYPMVRSLLQLCGDNEIQI